MKNGKLTMTVIGMVLLLSGFIMGSMRAQLRADEKFVQKDQYRIDMAEIRLDMAEIKTDIKQLLEFHLKHEH